MRNRWIDVAAAFLGVLIFAWIAGFALLAQSNPYWHNPAADMTTMLGGYEALLHSPWRLPPTVVTLLNGQPISIVYTDSIPWLAMLLKISPLGHLTNPLSVFLLLSYPLQALSMVALLRALGERRPVPLLIGAGLAVLFPPFLGRQFGHIALAGQWIEIYALALSVASIRLGLSRNLILGFLILGAVATGVHAYHLVPLAACFGAVLISELLQRRPQAIVRVTVAAILMLASVGLTALFLGYNYGLGPTGGAASLGYYGMNVLAPILPVGSRLAGQQFDGGWFTHVVDPTGSQSFGGLQYPGAGALLLELVMLATALRYVRPRHFDGPNLRRWGPLIAAFLVLFVWSVGWAVYVGNHLVVQLPKPSGRLAEMLGAFRAYGRFFWAVGYFLLAVSIVGICSKLRPVYATALLVGAFALQVWDGAPMREGVRSVLHPRPTLIPSALWDAEALKSRPWRFAPTYACSRSVEDGRLLTELTLLAMTNGGSSNTYYTARNTDGPCSAPDARIGVNAAPGDDTITALPATMGVNSPEFMIAAGRSDCHRASRLVLCGRGLSDISGFTPLRLGQLAPANGQALFSQRFDQGSAKSTLIEGWAELDPGGQGVWSVGKRATLMVPFRQAGVTPDGVDVEFRAVAFSDETLHPQRLTVWVNGEKIARLEVEPLSFGNYSFVVPARTALKHPLMEIVFDLPDAQMPKADPRVLGIAIQSIDVRAVSAGRPNR